jgi:hypothetical protein
MLADHRSREFGSRSIRKGSRAVVRGNKVEMAAGMARACLDGIRSVPAPKCSATSGSGQQSH